MSAVLKLGNAILGEWRSGHKGRAAMPCDERRTRQRRNSLSRLAHLRLTQGLALGEATGWALVIANVIGGLGREVTGQAIAQMAVSFGLPPLDLAIADAVAQDAEMARRLWGAGRHQLLTSKMVAGLLSVTAAEREDAGILDIDAVDETPIERRRRLDRDRKKAERAKRAALARPQLTQAQMAAAAGVSLSTWQRRQRDLKHVGSSSGEENARAHVLRTRVRKQTPNRSASNLEPVPGGDASAAPERSIHANGGGAA